METTWPQLHRRRNRAPVLKAFDTLFNRRDYVGAARFWSDRYIQHSAHIPPGRDGLFNLVRGLPDTLRYENHLIPRKGTSPSAMGDSQAMAVRGMDCCRYRPLRRRQARRALGRSSGRGHRSGIRQRPANVWRPVPGLRMKRTARHRAPVTAASAGCGSRCPQEFASRAESREQCASGDLATAGLFDQPVSEGHQSGAGLRSDRMDRVVAIGNAQAVFGQANQLSDRMSDRVNRQAPERDTVSRRRRPPSARLYR